MEKDYEKETLPRGLQVINDGFEVVGRPDGLGALLVNLERAQESRARMQEGGARISFLPLLVKATALAVRCVPESSFFLKGRTLFKPRSIDVGVSVAGRRNYAPVILVKSAATKSCKDIAEIIREESRIKRRNEEEDLRRVAWAFRFVPVRFLRRWLIRKILNFFSVVRGNYGCIQVSTLAQFDFFWPLRTATTACVAMGAVGPRPMAMGGEVRVCLSAFLTVGMNHKVLDGVKTEKFLCEIRRLLENPEDLEREPAHVAP